MERASRGGSLRRACLLIPLAALICGCAGAEKKDQGTVVGGIVGATLGGFIADDRVKGAAIGLVAGALLGRLFGQYMDEQDRQRASEALETTPTGQTTSWSNAQTGKEFALTPTSERFERDGRQCREFETQMVVNGQPRTVPGTACRRAEGESWDLVDV